MIITCEKCSTRFNLDDSLVNETGSNVRCSVCKHIFTAYPMPQPALDDDPGVDDSPQETDSFENQDESEAFDSLSFEAYDLTLGNDDLKAEDDLSFADDDFSLDMDSASEPDDTEFAEQIDDTEFAEQIDDTEFEGIESEPLEDDEFKPEFTIETDGTASEAQTHSDLSDADESDEDGPVLEDTDQEAEPDQVIPPQDDFSTNDDIPEQKTEPDIESSETATAPEPETLAIKKKSTPFQPYPVYRRPKQKSLVGTLVLILLLVFLLVAGAYIASILTGYNLPYLSDIKIPYIEKMLPRKQAATLDVKPVLNQKSVQGRFVANSSAGTLFVIEGNVENPSNDALRHIEISGSLIIKEEDGKRKTVKTKNAFCGNIIDTDKLKTQKISDINSQLLKKEGRNNANMNIRPGESVPFMIVFSDLPENLENFIVKIAGFEKIDTG